MAVPSSGPISFSTIAAERCSSLSNLSLRTMSSLASKTVPDGVSEFYGYTFCPTAGNFCSQSCSGCNRLTYTRNPCNCLCDNTIYTVQVNGCDSASSNFCSSYCSGYDLYYCYSSVCTGACSYCNLVESNSATCGYVPPYYYWYADCGPISISGPTGSFSGQYIEGYFARDAYYTVYWSNSGGSTRCNCYLYIGTGGYTTSDVLFYVSYYDGGGGCVSPGTNTYGPSYIYI